jgi:four helix bundle protein
MSEKKSVLKEKSFVFAVRVIKLYQHLSEQKREFVLSKQILRSGTSVGANVREAQNAESNADFTHKLAIAQKEMDETLYWLELLQATEYITEKECLSLKNDAEEILKMLKSAILTTKQKLITHNS